MYKRIITLVVIGFGLLLALGLATNYFLYQKLQQRVDEAIAEKLLLNQTRVPVRIAQLAHMLMVQTVGDFLIDPSPGEAFDNRRRQEQNAQKDATAKIRNAFAATQNPELQNIGQKLIKHHGQVTVRWGNEVIRLATIDLKAAQGSYWQNFLPAQAEGMTLLDEALRISSEELDHFHARSNESTVQAQFIFGASIILSACLGLGIAFFLGQTVVRLTRLTEKTAKEHKDMMDHSLDVFCSINDAGRFIRVSSACEQNWGYTADELVGQPYIALVHPDDVEQTLQAQATIMTGESIRDFDNRYIHKDGSTVHNRWSVQWLSDKRQLICVAHDMTQVDRSIQVLQASEERTRLILATGHDAFVGLDADGNIIDWNQQAQTTFGWAEEEARGKAFQDLIVSPPFRAQYRGIIEQLKSDSKTHTTNQRIELSALHRDGHELPIEFSISLLCRGDTFMFSAFLRDITERRKWETQLSQAKETAEAATSAKSAFLANMSHEIRTPMNGVIGLAALMLKTPLSPQQLEFMTLIKSSADSLLRLLNDILDFSKMEANKLELVAIQFDIRELLGDTLKAFSALANEKGLELAYRVAPEVPLLMLGDPGRLAQIIVNLTGNALKFTEQGEVTVRVTQESHTPDKAILRFSIVDTGIGMSTKQQGHIFNGFEQGDSSTTRRYGGTGLGLTIAAQLVKMMGGTIWVESEPGKGTTFHFTVRLAIPEKQSVPVQRLPGIVNKMPVLVVDDNITHRQILADILNSWSMQPTLTKGGREGLAEMQRMAALGTSFPLVLLDSRMPEFDGFELAQCIKDTPALAGTTIMMLSSSDASDEIERCKALSITHFLRKPIKQSELFNAITSAMSIECNIDSSSAYVTNPQSAISNPARLLKVLIAEDHPINQKVVVEILRERGHAFAIANNGIEALQMLEHEAFDVVLMDGQMPEMDGYEATAEIRRREKETGKHIRIIALTALAMKSDREKCLAAGMDDYISKPVDADLLIQRLESERGSPDPVAIDKVKGTTAAGKAFDEIDALKRAKGKEAFLKRLAHVFLKEMPQTMTNILEAIKVGDALQLERFAHRLKGAASTMSAIPVAEAAAKIEVFARRGELGCIDEALEELEMRSAELIIELEAFIGRSTP